ncbi:MAG: hypothetical protein K2L02_01040 [Clostridia bacterium]|nr:hypothetical protein [Clostridia bacterium]
MTIDIVDLTSADYSNLSPIQLAMVRAAQSKKDKIVKKAEQDKNELKFFMIANNTARSTALRDALNAIDSQKNADIEIVKSDLDYQLAYEALGSEGNDKGPYRYPQNPNYNLSYSERFLVVRQYYMDVTSDPNARLKAYGADTLARSYLGEYYQTLYDLLRSYC